MKADEGFGMRDIIEQGNPFKDAIDGLKELSKHLKEITVNYLNLIK